MVKNDYICLECIEHIFTAGKTLFLLFLFFSKIYSKIVYFQNMINGLEEKEKNNIRSNEILCSVKCYGEILRPLKEPRVFKLGH